MERYLIGSLKKERHRRFYELSYTCLDRMTGENECRFANHNRAKLKNPDSILVQDNNTDSVSYAIVMGTGSEKFTNCVLENFFQSFGTDSFIVKSSFRKKSDLVKSQTYTKWKVSYGSKWLLKRKLSKRKVIYLQPFTDLNSIILDKKFIIERCEYSVLDLCCEFAEIFFSGMKFSILPPFDIFVSNWKIGSRITSDTNKFQWLVRDLFQPLRSLLPKDGFCILGITSSNLYPAEEYKAVLGESSFMHRSGVFTLAASHDQGDNSAVKDINHKKQHKIEGENSHCCNMENCAQNCIFQGKSKETNCNHILNVSNASQVKGDNHVYIDSLIPSKRDKQQYNCLIQKGDNYEQRSDSFNKKKGREDNAIDQSSVIDGKLLWKTFRVLSHETCHLFRMDHCEFFHCAMNESHAVSEAMEQPLFLCPVCLRKLQTVCKFDVVVRYRRLHEFLKRVCDAFPCDKIRDSLLWLDKLLQNFFT